MTVTERAAGQLHRDPPAVVATACAGLSKAELLDLVALLVGRSFGYGSDLPDLARQARQNQHWRAYDAAQAEYEALVAQQRALAAAAPLVGPRLQEYLALSERIEQAYQRGQRACAAGDTLWKSPA